MSTQMKSFITTLDLVMRDKVDPETVVEEDEIEEILTINEDGELLSELHPHQPGSKWGEPKPGSKWGPEKRRGDLRFLHKDKPKRDLGDLRHWTESKNIDEDGSYTGGRNWQGDDEANYPTRVTPKRNVGRRNLGDVEGIPKVADVDAQTQAVDDFSSEHPVLASLQP